MTWKMWNCGNRNVEMEMWKWLSSNIVKNDQKLCCVVLLDGFKLRWGRSDKDFQLNLIKWRFKNCNIGNSKLT